MYGRLGSNVYICRKLSAKFLHTKYIRIKATSTWRDKEINAKELLYWKRKKAMQGVQIKYNMIILKSNSIFVTTDFCDDGDSDVLNTIMF